MSVEKHVEMTGHERALQLARKTSFEHIPFEKILERVPDDWEEGEADIDEFLSTLRGRDQYNK